MQDYVVCRCEDVTLGDVRGCLAAGSGVSLNEVKRRLRAGMGWCQGRVCGPLLAELAGTEEILDRNRVLRPTLLAGAAQCSPPDHDGGGSAPAERQGP